MRARGFYEARASHGSEIIEDGAIVSVNLTRGPRVVVRFTGDPLPENERERLVPVRTEGSADEDLLEDSSRAIEDYLYTRGYRDAMVVYTSQQEKEELVITFAINAAHVTLSVTCRSPATQPSRRRNFCRSCDSKTGEPFVRSTVSTGTGAIERLYRARGFTRAQVKAGESISSPKTLLLRIVRPTCRLRSSRGRER